MKKGLIKGAAALLGLLAVSEAGASAYFYRRTMKRNRLSVERTIKMSGTDWGQYGQTMQERKDYMLAQPHEEVWRMSEDGLRLHATFFPNQDSKKIALCLHGYTSQGMSDYIGLSGYYLKHGFAMFLPDARAHGQSEGEYVGFGCLDRYDLLGWLHWIMERCGEDVQILLHGTSMGGATVLMARAGYGLDDCNAAREVRKAKVPMLLIHGSADSFVPCRMCEEIYENCASPKKKLIIEGAAHAESYYKDPESYEKALDEFIGGILK